MPIDDLTSISTEEQEKFSKHLFRFHVGSVIIHEGYDDNSVYLLREGTVAVERMVGDMPTQISTIEAVNFFGEMAMIVGANRTATIRVISPQAIVYKFPSFDLKTIYSNPVWSELLIKRLCNDLIETNNRANVAENDNKHLSAKNANMIKQGGLLLSALLSLQGNVAAAMMLNGNDWKIVRGMHELTENFLKTNLPEILEEVNLHGQNALKKLKNGENFPDILKQFKE
jgi:signal-transduction protein with cAMP-binding, CBS, and nucleotidyltransferase domain